MDILILKNFAKKLIPLSLEDGQVSEHRVEAVLKSLENTHFNSVQKKRILKYYLSLIKKELKKRQAIVEYSGALSEKSVESIRQKLEKFYQTSLSVETEKNNSLLAGLRIAVGDDVWDASLWGYLEQFKQKF